MDSNIKETDKTKREMPTGILRAEPGKSRRTSVELKFLKQGEPASPQPSVDRLSVTFAEDSLKSDSSTKCNYYCPTAPTKMDKVHFPQGTDVEESDEEDYSASVNAIFQRRASTRRSRRRSTRRASSPFSPDILLGSENGRRRSSVFTTSSGDTAITMDENVGAATQEEIFENIKLHKEVLSNVKMQPWNMRKKLKLVVQAKSYIKKHEGALQERLAQSRSTKDMLARWNIYLIKKWQSYRRELANLSNWFIPWELKIKEIESHFGSVVASYFTFLRWLFWVNIVLGVVLISFVAIPEMLTANWADPRKHILTEEKYNSTNFQTLWDFEGIFKYSPLFYGWYTKQDKIKGYRMPLAYFITGLVVYAYSFFAILRKMAENSRMSKLSEKDDECIFSWKLFTAWDYMIGNAETAHNRVASIVVGFKEALLEEAEKKRESRNWKVTGFRILVNTIVLGLLFFSAFAVVVVVLRSKEPEARKTVWRSNEITIVMSLISLFFPMIFEVLGLLEQYHPRKQLRLQLARIMVLNLLNLYSLIFALFNKINDMTTDLDVYRNLSRQKQVKDCSKFCYGGKILIAANLIQSLISNSSLTPQQTLPNINENATLNYEYNMTQLLWNTTDSSTNYISENNAFDFDKFLDNFENTSSSNDLSGFEFNATYFKNDKNSSFTVTENYSETTFEYLNTTQSPFVNMNVTASETDADFHTPPTKIFYRFATKLKDNSTAERCEIICNNSTNSSAEILEGFASDNFNYSAKSKLRRLCWETMFGQELIKLTVMDLIMTVLSTLALDLVRGVFVRFMNRCWCWDLEKTFPQYGDFKVAENILHLVNNQGMVWMGMFFSPGLVAINVFKLFALMYFRAWIVLTCNVPHEIIFRASRSNNFYYALLLMMLFLCVLPVGYAIVWIRPSWHCGPFSGYPKIFHILTTTVKDAVPDPIKKALDYIASPGIIIPLLVLLILIIYYLISLTNALREANNDLKIQLRRERTEERRKMFQIADKRRRGGSGGSGEFSNAPFAKWKKILGTIPNSGKSFDETPRQDSNEFPQIIEETIDSNKNKDFFSKLIKKAIGKSSTSDEENQENENLDEGTDTEQHESLPEDVVSIKDSRAQQSAKSSGSFDLPKVTNLLQKRNSQKSNSESEKHVQIKNEKNQDMRQDSGSSVWSDNIPIITISKTESAEGLDEVPELPKERRVEKSATTTETRFKPKIKCALTKQSTEIDEDTICYFNQDLDLNPELACFDQSLEKEFSKTSESSDDTRENSAATVVKSPKVAVSEDAEEKEQKISRQNSSTNGSATESSAEYNDVTSL